MFGTDFALYPEILLNSLKKTNESYATHYAIFQFSPILKFLFKIYIFLFGIPEIGFQLRALYFLKNLKGIKNFHPQKILDAGSGIGFYTFTLRKLYPQAQIVGVDVDEKKLEFCKKYTSQQNFRNIQFAKKDISKTGDFKNKYDLIVNIDVLEHIKDYKAVLENFYHWLEVDGYLYLHVPQVNQKRIFKRFFANWQHKEHECEGFHPKKLKEELEELGFRKVQYSNCFGFWGSLAWELNHITLSRSLFLAGLIFPPLYLLAKLDIFWPQEQGLTFLLVANK
jgi:2-polyprenyl-3-methyl-5-hydroxy-6-metoxy-1,4-benzoquinol methylase